MGAKSDYESANRLFLSNTRGILNKIPNTKRIDYILNKINILFPLDDYYNLIFGPYDFEISSEYLYPISAHPVEKLLNTCVLSKEY